MCYFRCMLVTSTPTKIMLLGAVFQSCKTPMQKFGNLSQAYAPAHRFMPVGRSQYRISVWKAVLYWWHKKTKCVLVLFGGTLGAISPDNFYASVHSAPTIILQVSSKPVQTWGSYTQKTFPWPPKWIQYRLFERVTSNIPLLQSYVVNCQNGIWQLQ